LNMKKIEKKQSLQKIKQNWLQVWETWSGEMFHSLDEIRLYVIKKDTNDNDK
jgi:hypothetical protein